MKMVIRERYLSKLNRFKDKTDKVKVITGIRRCGKSTLLKQYIQSLKASGIEESKIIHINFESFDFDWIKSYEDLSVYVRDKAPEGRVYVFLDEIQRVEKWEKAVSSMMVDLDADIYITGSNAYFLSTELSTYMSGRSVQIKMLPLSFKEFMDMHSDGTHTIESRFSEYIRLGSMPIVDIDLNEEDNRNVLEGVFDTVLVKDVLTHSGINDVSTLMSIIRFIFSNVGNTTSVNNIANTLGIDRRVVVKTMEAFENAYIIFKAERYDIRGRKLLKTLEKYYIADTGIRNAVLGISSREDESRLMENIVYLELIRRGYEVCVGKYGDTEVDFTARKGNDIEYFQVTQTMAPENVYEREVRSLNMIRDNYPKTILSSEGYQWTVPNGLKHKRLTDWLLEE
jgi:predicted AAA+ superfamily ATPase